MNCATAAAATITIICRGVHALAPNVGRTLLPFLSFCLCHIKLVAGTSQTNDMNPHTEAAAGYSRFPSPRCRLCTYLWTSLQLDIIQRGVMTNKKKPLLVKSSESWLIMQLGLLGATYAPRHDFKQQVQIDGESKGQNCLRIITQNVADCGSRRV